jgi:PKHD-type hydroxylase
LIEGTPLAYRLVGRLRQHTEYPQVRVGFGGVEPPYIETQPVFVPEHGPYYSHLVYPEVFSAQECKRLVQLGDRQEIEPAQLEADDPDDETLRRAAIAWIPYESGTEWIFDRLGTIAQEANQGYGFEVTGFAEDIQYTVYDEAGSFYTWHQDGLDGMVAGRKLALVVQLSDPGDYGGGELEFVESAVDLATSERESWLDSTGAQGTVIVFPTFEYHRVLPLERGTRRSLVAWIGGPPFR